MFGRLETETTSSEAFTFFPKSMVNIHSDLGIFYILIVFRHQFNGIHQRVVSDGEEFRVFPDSFHVPGSFSVAESVLDKIGGVFGLFS